MEASEKYGIKYYCKKQDFYYSDMVERYLLSNCKDGCEYESSCPIKEILEDKLTKEPKTEKEELLNRLQILGKELEKRHSCGAQGFGMSVNDECSACEKEKK